VANHRTPKSRKKGTRTDWWAGQGGVRQKEGEKQEEGGGKGLHRNAAMQEKAREPRKKTGSLLGARRARVLAVGQQRLPPRITKFPSRKMERKKKADLIQKKKRRRREDGAARQDSEEAGERWGGKTMAGTKADVRKIRKITRGCAAKKGSQMLRCPVKCGQGGRRGGGQANPPNSTVT